MGSFANRAAQIWTYGIYSLIRVGVIKLAFAMWALVKLFKGDKMEQAGAIGSNGTYDLKFEGVLATANVAFIAGPAKVSVVAEFEAKQAARAALVWLESKATGFTKEALDIAIAALDKV